jgi:hypothetical protein
MDLLSIHFFELSEWLASNEIPPRSTLDMPQRRLGGLGEVIGPAIFEPWVQRSWGR